MSTSRELKSNGKKAGQRESSTDGNLPRCDGVPEITGVCRLAESEYPKAMPLVTAGTGSQPPGNHNGLPGLIPFSEYAKNAERHRPTEIAVKMTILSYDFACANSPTPSNASFDVGKVYADSNGNLRHVAGPGAVTAKELGEMGLAPYESAVLELFKLGLIPEEKTKHLRFFRPAMEAYALGAIGFSLLTKRYPIEWLLSDDALAIEAAILPPSAYIPDPWSIPPALDRLVHASLARDPRTRPNGIKAFVRELMPFLPVGYRGMAGLVLRARSLSP